MHTRKTCKINIHFKGKEFEKLNLVIRQESKDFPPIIIHGNPVMERIGHLRIQTVFLINIGM